jgi:uncharacterized protein
MIIFYLFLASLVAFSISLICGGGAGLLLIPILGYLLPAAQVPVALSIGTSVSSITKIYLFYKQINWRVVQLFLPLAIPGVILGAWLLSYMNPMYIELCMAIFLVSNLIYVFKKSDSQVGKNNLPDWILSFIGLLAGFVSGLTGAVGVLFNRIYFRYGLDKAEIVATRSANEIILHIIKLGLYGYFGLFTLQVLEIGLIVAVSAVISTLIMKVVLPKISIKVFSKMGYTAMVVSGVLMLNSAVVTIQEHDDPSVEVIRMVDGFDAAFSWRDLIYTVEFKYGEGFEFEKIIPLSSLTPAKQAFVTNQHTSADKVVIEKVYSLRSVSYEAYYYDEKNRLIEKIKFQ